VLRQFTRLSEGASATWVVANVGLEALVNEEVLLKVLGKRKRLVAVRAGVLFGLVGCLMPFKTKPSRVLFGADRVGAGEGSCECH
jgi:hypothetical protein